MSEWVSELDKLEKYLKKHRYNYTRKQRLDDIEEKFLNKHLHKTGGEQIVVFDEYGNRLWDAICGYGSYGYELGLLEIMGSPVIKPSDFESVAGYLTADNIIQRLESKQ